MSALFSSESSRVTCWSPFCGIRHYSAEGAWSVGRVLSINRHKAYMNVTRTAAIWLLGCLGLAPAALSQSDPGALTSTLQVMPVLGRAIYTQDLPGLRLPDILGPFSSVEAAVEAYNQRQRNTCVSIPPGQLRAYTQASDVRRETPAPAPGIWRTVIWSALMSHAWCPTPIDGGWLPPPARWVNAFRDFGVCPSSGGFMSGGGWPNSEGCRIFIRVPRKKPRLECPKGNPIFAGNGAKKEIANDFIDERGRLSIVRSYYSARVFAPRGQFALNDIDRFLSNGNREGIASSLRGQCLRATAASAVGVGTSACFTALDQSNLSPSAGGVVLVDELGEQTILRVNAASSFGEAGWTRLSVTSSALGFRVRNPDLGRFETYELDGRLKRITWLDGTFVDINYELSSSLGVSGHARLLPVARTDNTGRSSSLAYDGEGHLQSVLTPAGTTIS
jgi:YD repeat-containing protein